MAKTVETNITIKNIAEQLGVSFSTVAKALNDDPSVKEETRLRVKQKAAEMGYLPNVIAKGLRGKTTKTVGIILNDIENPTRTHIVKKILVDLAEHGFTTLIFDSLYDLAIERNNIITVLSRRPDAVVISPVSIHSENLSLLSNIFDRTVILSREFESVPANYVHMDHKRGGYIATKTMINSGHQCNIIFTEPADFPSSEQFLAGVHQAYAEHGITCHEEMMIYGTPSMQVGFRGIIDLYDRQEKQFKISFTGIITNCDLYAFGVYQAIGEIGLNIPEDVSVMGYDDIPMAAMTIPPLTTMHNPIEEIAAHCSDILISKLVYREPVIKSFSIAPYLIERASIKKINHTT
jgi:LacI family transcriptional regulator